MANILVVDDEIGIRELLSEILQDEGHSVVLAENAAGARAHRLRERPDLVLLDIWMPDTDGVSLLKEWGAAGQLTMPVVMMSGHGTIDTAVEATRMGAVDFLEKPIALQKLLATVKKALRHETPMKKAALTLKDVHRIKGLHDFARRMEQAARKSRVLMLKGANDWLAEVCARTLHTPSTPWLDLSASSSPLNQETLEKSMGGVLFVPELLTLGRMQQLNTAFVLDRLERYNLLLVVATTASTTQLVEHGWDPAHLRTMGEVWLSLPPLSAHADDIPEFAALVLGQMADRSEAPLRRFTSAALNQLRQHDWRGGWVELQKLIRNLALTALEDDIDVEDLTTHLGEEGLPPDVLRQLFDKPLKEARDGFEKLYLEFHLRQDGHHMTKLAERTGLERTHLYRKIKQLGVNVPKRGEE